MSGSELDWTGDF